MKKRTLIAIFLVLGISIAVIAAAETSTEAKSKPDLQAVVADDVPNAAEQARRKLPVVESNQFSVTLGEYELIATTQSPVLRKSLIDNKEKRTEFLEKIINSPFLHR